MWRQSSPATPPAFNPSGRKRRTASMDWITLAYLEVKVNKKRWRRPGIELVWKALRNGGLGEVEDLLNVGESGFGIVVVAHQEVIVIGMLRSVLVDGIAGCADA